MVELDIFNTNLRLDKVGSFFEENRAEFVNRIKDQGIIALVRTMGSELEESDNEARQSLMARVLLERISHIENESNAVQNWMTLKLVMATVEDDQQTAVQILKTPGVRPHEEIESTLQNLRKFSLEKARAVIETANSEKEDYLPVLEELKVYLEKATAYSTGSSPLDSTAQATDGNHEFQKNSARSSSPFQNDNVGGIDLATVNVQVQGNNLEPVTLNFPFDPSSLRGVVFDIENISTIPSIYHYLRVQGNSLPINLP